MKKRKILISLLVVAVLLFAGVYANANEMDTKVTEKNDAKKLHEIESKRTLSSRAYAMSDGSIMHELFATNINYKDKSGKLQKIDIKVKDLDTKRSNGYKFSNGANDWNVYFADKGKAKDMVKIKQGSYEIGFSMNKSKDAAIASKSSGLARSKSKIHDYYREDPTVVIYNDVQPNVDLAYTIRESYLKEEIVLNEKPATNEFIFDINVKNISLVLKDGTLYYNDAKTGKTVFSSSNLFMHDSDENYSDNVSMKLESKEKNIYTLTVIADEKFLNDENTKYPVVIDPTIQNNSTYDVFVASKYNMDDTNMNSGSSRAPYLRTGKDSDYYVRRTYIKFRDSDISNAVGNNRIVGANVSLMRYSSKGSINIRAYRAAGSWNSSSLTWNNKPGYISSSYKPGSKWGTTDWYRINLIDWAKGWANGSITNNGLVIRDTNEGSTSVWATFRSSDNWATDRRPKLEIITISPEPTPVPTAVPTAVPTNTPQPTATPVATATPTPIPTATPEPTATPVPTLGTLQYWHSTLNNDENIIQRWNITPKAYSNDLTESNLYPQIVNDVSDALDLWDSAVSTETTTSVSEANIKFYFGFEDELINELECTDIPDNYAGIMFVQATDEGIWIFENQQNVNEEKTGQKIISARGGAIFPNASTPYPVVLHEIGHALGWYGHSSNSNDKMNPGGNMNETLTARDLEHIAQVND